MRFTTSWDDGYALDLELLALLKKHGSTGTFYVCPVTQHGQEMLTEGQIKSIGDAAEVGAHSLSHAKLTTVSPEEARKEIAGSKAWIEGITGKPCAMFCYPKGDWNEGVKAIVREAGYGGARTVGSFCFAVTDPYAMATSLQVYPFPLRASYWKWWHVFDPFAPLRVHRRNLDALGIAWKDRGSWLSVAKAVFRKAHADKQPVFHLWGHSEEVKRLGMWDDLDAFLAFVRTFPDVEHVTNGALLPNR